MNDLRTSQRRSPAPRIAGRLALGLLLVATAARAAMAQEPAAEPAPRQGIRVSEPTAPGDGGWVTTPTEPTAPGDGVRIVDPSEPAEAAPVPPAPPTSAAPVVGSGAEVSAPWNAAFEQELAATELPIDAQTAGRDENLPPIRRAPYGAWGWWSYFVGEVGLSVGGQTVAHLRFPDGGSLRVRAGNGEWYAFGPRIYLPRYRRTANLPLSLRALVGLEYWRDDAKDATVSLLRGALDVVADVHFGSSSATWRQRFGVGYTMRFAGHLAGRQNGALFVHERYAPASGALFEYGIGCASIGYVLLRYHVDGRAVRADAFTARLTSVF